MHCCENHQDPQKYAVSICPVCGMEVHRPNPKLATLYKGQKYDFCVEACLNEFKRHPERCLKAKKGLEPRKIGLWGRYLDRLNKATGGKAIKCH
ncbi:MAG: YHS domain-containing protein [Deltaproteobacteria bacterium]|nr:YHS domain-containing protein [Deltaproteobacteria bacterium]MBW2042574.1 YHS domain-containing protein [Deltaproteobacteria bacterium]MBW2130928.1 YHS domain-containing protein [Deltaproteobacteria bacterium]